MAGHLHCWPQFSVVHTKRLLSRAEIEIYAARYAERAASPSPLRDVLGARLRGVYERGELVGGYGLNPARPFRLLRFAQTGDEALLPGPVDAWCELICVWFTPTASQLARTMLYAHFLRDVPATGRRWLLGGTCRAPVCRVLAAYLPHLIYEGPGADENEGRTTWLFAGDLRTMVRGAVLNGLAQGWPAALGRSGVTAAAQQSVPRIR